MADWSYGDAGDRYPMKRGEVWTIGDKAMLAVGDIELGDTKRLVTFAREHAFAPTAFYSDPPWDAGNVRSFRTKAFGKENSYPVDFVHTFIDHILYAATCVAGPAAIEMGNKHLDDLVKAIEQLGFKTTESRITYYKTNECRVVCFCTVDKRHEIYADSLAGSDDVDTPTLFCEQLAGVNVVFDCCMGQGQTAVSAIQTGHRALGLELNPRRMACTVDKVVKLVGVEPVLAGSFWSDHGQAEEGNRHARNAHD